MVVGKKNSKISRPAVRGARGKGGEIFDATPEEDGVDISHDGKSAGKPHDIRKTKAWEKGEKGAKKIANNYFSFLRRSFDRMSRSEQLREIEKFCLAFSLGIAAVVLCLFYQVLPMALRVISLPLIGALAWWLSVKVIAPQVIIRLEPLIHPSDGYGDE